MSIQIKKKFIKSQAIDGTKVLFLNDQAFKALNQNGSEAELFKLDASNNLVMIKNPQVAADPVAANDLARKAYIDAEIDDVELLVQETDEALRGAVSSDFDSLKKIEDRIVAAENESADIRVDFAAADVAVKSELRGDVSNNFNTLEKIEDELVSLDGRLDTVQGADTVSGSFAKADKDLKSSLVGSATEYTDFGLVEDELDSVNSRLETLQGSGAGSVASQISAVQTELDGTQTGAGLNSNGSYSANGSANYIAAAVSLKDADNKLDAAIKAEETARINAITSVENSIETEKERIDAILLAADADKDSFAEIVTFINSVDTTNDNAFGTYVTNNNARVGDVEDELDATQTGAGLGSDGSYSANGSANYIAAAVSLKDADNKLDAAIKARADAIAAEVERATDAEEAIQGELDSTQTGAGLGSDGSYSANGSANYIAAAVSLKDADNKLDAAIKARADAIAAEVERASDAEEAIQSELDATQSGAGLSSAGAYVAKGDANYIAAAVSLKDADNKLDAALKVEEEARIDAIESVEGRLDVLEDDDTVAGSVAYAVKQEEVRALAAESALDGRLDTLEAGDNVAGSVAYAVKQEEIRALAAEGALDGRLDVIEGSGAGSVAKALVDAKAYADQKVADLVDSAPALLDTLNELAAAINDDANFAATIGTRIGETETDIARIDGASNVEGSFRAADAAIVGDAGSEYNTLGKLEDKIQAEVSARETAIEDFGLNFANESFTVTSNMIADGFVDLAHKAFAASMVVSLDRLMLFESEDFSVSISGGKTRLTFAGSIVPAGDEALAVGDKIKVRYLKDLR